MMPSTATVVWSSQWSEGTHRGAPPSITRSRWAYSGGPGSWLGQRGSRACPWFLFPGWNEMFLFQLVFLPLLPAEPMPTRAPSAGASMMAPWQLR